MVYSSTFPSEAPPDLDDPMVIAGGDRAAFLAVDAMVRHWDRPHRTSYHWLIRIGEHPDAVALARRCQDLLPVDGMDRIPAEWLHLTVRRLGYHDELTTHRIDESIDAVSRLVTAAEPFELMLLPLAGSPGAVRFSVAPWTPLLDLYRVVVEGSRLDPVDPVTVYRPHVGVAYSNTEQDTAPIRAAVGRAAALAPVSILVDELALVRMDRADGYYRWDIVHRARLGGRCG